MTILNTCKTCKEQFEVRNYRKDKALYCSYKCYWGYSKTLHTPDRIICSKCKSTKDIKFFHKSRNGLFGRKSYCRSCAKTYFDNWKDKNYKKVSEKRKIAYLHKVKTPDELYKSFVHGARSRGKQIDLTKDEFLSLMDHKCAYCGSDVRTPGIDRVDSSKGYTRSNIVRCYLYCNKAKNNLTVSEFFEHTKKIVAYMSATL